MRLFLTVLRRKRGIILFVVAFMLPLFFVVAVSIDTITKRKQTTHNLLESNLWLSGRSALDQLESQFAEIEGKWLQSDNFIRILKDDTLRQNGSNPDIFLLDKDLKIVYPKTREDNNLQLLTFDNGWSSSYRIYMEKAENAALSSRNYLNAVKNYQKSLSLAETNQQKGLAIEGMARSYMADKNYKQAIRYYKMLKNEYSQIENLSCHPFGITAPLQLYTIGTFIKEKVISYDTLLITYQNLNNGNWLISSSSYCFFKAEYESILDIEIGSKQPKFEKILDFNQFLDEFVIPYVKEKSRFSELNNMTEPKRIYIPSENGQYLISYKEMKIPDTDELYFGGIRWNLDTIINQMIPSILSSLSEDTGLEFIIINNKNINLLTGELISMPDESLFLTFNNIPFPWTLIAIQPGYEKLESDIKVELIIYGLLIIIILILMFFGVIVLLRDINRETESILLKTEFVHNVSHELKTPLSLIRLYGETLLLKENLSDEDRKDGLLIITKESERLSHMINNILDFSKIEMGRKEFDLKTGNLAEVVGNTLNSYRYHFVKKGFKIKEGIDEDIPKVMFDPDAVEGILINLFSNVIKFSTNVKEIMLGLKKNPEGIRLILADKGVGIPPEELPNIFNRFYRVKGTTDYDASGSGLGLTLVKHIVDAHGWQIEVDSTPGQGSIFSITIPLNSNKEGLS
jgi:signal transduction histidine kinase